MDILIKGLNAFEQKILAATARLYEKREPKIRLTYDTEIDAVDVVIIDALDAQALSWSDTHKNLLDNKTVIWIDKETDKSNHAHLMRPVLWVNLPIIVTRILDDISVREIAPQYAADTKTNQPQPHQLKARPAAERSHPSPPPSKQATAAPKSLHDERPPKRSVRASAAFERKKILIVDDSLAIRNYLTSLLKQEGYAVKTAEDGAEGLELFKTDTFDCIFMDVMMPEIDGYEACRKIKGTTKGKQVPVIMLTGKGSPFDRIRGKMAGCNAYLVKPVDVSKLKETLRAHINAS